MAYPTLIGVLLVALPVVLSFPQQWECEPPPNDVNCNRPPPSWLIRLNRGGNGGTVVNGHAHTPVVNGVQGNIHGSKTFGGPQNGAQSIGGGLSVQGSSGLHGGVDGTHHRGAGTTYSGTVGGSTNLGPGTLSVDGAAYNAPGSSRIQGQVGATYTVPLP